MIAHIAVGSNLGDRTGFIESAIERLDAIEGIEVRRTSRLRETAPVGDEAQGPYLNGVIEVETNHDARTLLDACLAVERELGRERDTARRWGPRTIDLDLVLFGTDVIEEDGLSVPHPRMESRRFVLEPLAELIPDCSHPLLGVTIRTLLDRCVQGEST